jgi:hypothetical protein
LSTLYSYEYGRRKKKETHGSLNCALQESTLGRNGFVRFARELILALLQRRVHPRKPRTQC